MNRDMTGHLSAYREIDFNGYTQEFAHAYIQINMVAQSQDEIMPCILSCKPKNFNHVPWPADRHSPYNMISNNQLYPHLIAKLTPLLHIYTYLHGRILMASLLWKASRHTAQVWSSAFCGTPNTI